MKNKELKQEQQAGFTLLETAIAMVLLAIVGLGIASCFFFAAKNNSSARDRDLAMAVAQQQIERLRNAAFTDASLNAGTTNATITRGGRQYGVQTVITDGNVQNGSATTKNVQILVIPWSDRDSWARNVTSVFGSVTVICQRTALTVGLNRAL